MPSTHAGPALPPGTSRTRGSSFMPTPQPFAVSAEILKCYTSPLPVLRRRSWGNSEGGVALVLDSLQKAVSALAAVLAKATMSSS